MNPRQKRFNAKYVPMADAIARLDIPQTIREQVADALTEALTGSVDFIPRTFRLLASDPLCACPGHDDEGCPHGREIRVPMHLSSAPDGRSAVWAETKPVVRCLTCGMPEVVRSSL